MGQHIPTEGTVEATQHGAKRSRLAEEKGAAETSREEAATSMLLTIAGNVYDLSHHYWHYHYGGV